MAFVFKRKEKELFVHIYVCPYVEGLDTKHAFANADDLVNTPQAPNKSRKSLQAASSSKSGQEKQNDT